MQKPKLFTVLGGGYTKEQFFKDFSAGLIVGIIAIPLSIALAVASGVSPEKGLYTAIIAGFIISLLGGSRVQIGGPTGAFVAIIYGIIEKKGYPALVLATILAGIILIFMGLVKLGNVIKYIPYPITTGFTSGIALIIFSQQIGDFLGLKMEKTPSEFIPRIGEYIKSIDTINIDNLIVGIISLLIIISWPYINKKIPGSLVAIIASTIIAKLLGIQAETIGDRYNDLQAALPSIQLPHIDLDMIIDIFPSALTIAVLAGIESLMSAVVSDGMIGDKHNSNMELVGQGIANVFSGLFGGIPATGAIARTAANVRNGGRTPVAGIVHSAVVLAAMVLLMPYTKMIPIATLAAILMVVAYNMSEWRAFRNLFKAPKTDIAVLLFTFVLTVAVDLVIAIEFGVIISAFLFMKRMADNTKVESIKNEIQESSGITLANPEGIDPAIQVYQIYGPFFFGAADKFIQTIQDNISATNVVIIHMRHAAFMDATGYHALYKTYSFCRKHKILLLLTQVQKQPYELLCRNGFVELIGKDNFCPDIEHALVRGNAYAELNRKFPLRKYG
ncbi:MAG: SulP family inorganic anion transporter [Acetivibrionales bacterium]|jgi:SulP family sulfate permease